jgi:hypothetical protein
MPVRIEDIAPDVLLPCQQAERSHLDGESRLVLAVLEDAIRTYLKFKNREHKGPAYFETLLWFASDGMGPFSFLAICETFGFDARMFRKRLSEGKVVAPIRRQHARSEKLVAA